MKRRSWFALALGFGLAGYVGLRRYEHKPTPRRLGESRTAHRFRILDAALRDAGVHQGDAETPQDRRAA